MKPLFLVLEPNNHVYKVIEAAALRGHHVIVLHTFDLKGGGSYQAGFEAIAEHHRLDSWQDDDAILRWVASRVESGARLAGTYTAFETTLPLDARIRAAFGLPTEGATRYRELLHKPTVRQLLRQAGLSRLRTFDPRAVVTTGQWPADLHAAFLKPACGAASIHVSRCRDIEAVRAGLADWDAKSIACRASTRMHLDRGDLFMEEAAVGELMSVEGFSVGGRYTCFGLTSRCVLERDEAIEMGAVFPYEHPLRSQIIDKVAAIHAALRLDYCVTHAEVMCSVDGEVELVELNLRFGGADILLLMNLTQRSPIDEVLVDIACGLEPRLSGPAVPARVASLQLVLPPSGTASFDSLELDDPAVVETRLLKPLGSKLASTRHQVDQVATFIACAPSYRETLAAVRRARENLGINGQKLRADPNNAVLLR